MAFDRGYQLIVSEGVQSTGNKAVLIEDLQVEFNLSRSVDSKLNSSEFKIYNLSQKTRELIESFEQKSGFVKFSAGYKDAGIGQIFLGNIADISTEKMSTDMVTTIIAADGAFSTKNTITNKIFPEGTTLSSIIRRIVTEDLKLPLGEIQGKSLERIYQNGVTVEGNSYEYLKKVCSENKLQISIQDNVVNILPVQGTSTRTALVISEATGIIGSPHVIGQKAKDSTGAKTPKSGVKVSHLLLPEVYPGRILSVSSKFVNGTYKIDKFTHKGSYRDNDWTTDIEASVVSIEKEEVL